MSLPGKAVPYLEYPALEEKDDMAVLAVSVDCWQYQFVIFYFCFINSAFYCRILLFVLSVFSLNLFAFLRSRFVYFVLIWLLGFEAGLGSRRERL